MDIAVLPTDVRMLRQNPTQLIKNKSGPTARPVISSAPYAEFSRTEPIPDVSEVTLLQPCYH